MASQTVTPTQKTAAPERPRFKAVLSEQQASDFDASHNSKWTANRRLLMATMTLSSAQMLEKFAPLVKENDGEAFMQMYDLINNYREHLKAGVDMADSALARLLLVGQYIADTEETEQS